MRTLSNVSGMGVISMRVILILVTIVATAYADQSNLYDFHWLDKDKLVYVLQNKVFAKEGTFYGTVGIGNSLDAEFQDSMGVLAYMGYFFSEEWGMELLYSKFSHENDTTFKNVAALNSLEPFVRKVNDYMGAMVMYAPFYGKINTFNRIFYFDWMFGVGFAKLNEETNRNLFDSNSATIGNTTESKTGLLWKTNVKFYVTRNFNISFELINLNYKSKGVRPEDGEAWRWNKDIFLGVGFSF